MRVSKEDWVIAATELLTKEGHSSLSVERLARKLGVTRGSFYHHFSGVDDMHDAVLDDWKKAHTETVLYGASVEEPLAEINRLIQSIPTMSLDLEIHINAWAASNPRIAKFVAGIEKMRMERLVDIYQQLCQDDEKGRRLAKIGYYGLLGAAHAIPRLTREELQVLLMEVHEVMMAFSKTNAPT